MTQFTREMSFLLYLTTCFLSLNLISSYQLDCSPIEHDRCVKIADPLIKEAHLVFPDNMDDIDLVCRTWNKFVDCLKRYTDKCFTDQQRRQFNKAVENPIESVHQMCMQPSYQKEYLQYAPCIKNTITERSHCGPQYSLLVDQVAQGEIISKASVCCSHDKFKQCIQRETRRTCDRGVQDGPAAKFSEHILEKALSFLQDQCFNYIPNSGDCVSFTQDTMSYNDPIISTAPSEIFPWSTIQENHIAAKEIPSANMGPPKPSSSTWMPSPSSVQPDTNNQKDGNTPVLGSRTRPGSYGRSNSWGDSASSNSQNSGGGQTVQMYPGTQMTSSPRPDWATMSTWNVFNRNTQGSDGSQNDRASTSSTGGTETWYPAAGNQLSNEVDEPNQQGLSYNRNGVESTKEKRLFSLTLVATMLAKLC